MIGIVDYNIGNIAAVANMLTRIGEKCRFVSTAADLHGVRRVVLPGNGSFDACMRNLRGSGMVPALEDLVLGKCLPLLGICVGAQMLGINSEEGVEPGLGWLDLRVRKFPDTLGIKVPHMGWTGVQSSGVSHQLTRHLESDSRFYFVHSYFMDPAASEDLLLKATYGLEFAAAVARNNIVGVQFHPEKSHRFGKELLKKFCDMT